MAEVTDDSRMPLMEHLAELRRRLIISFAAIAAGAVVCWIFYDWIIDFLMDPYCEIVSPDEECKLYVRNPLEPFNVKLTVVGYGGIAAAMPVILWQLWRFIAPGLYSHEKK